MTKESKQGVECPSGYKDLKRQTRYLRDRWSWTDETIWNENMLKALDNGVKGGKWFSLIDKTYRYKTLKRAWNHVASKKGAAGIDKVSIGRIAQNPDIYLRKLEEDLREGKYRPEPVKRVHIPKGDGKTRPLGIPTVMDRVAQMAVKLAIEPIFEKEFLSMSYGFRPGKGAKDALRHVDQSLQEGFTWVVDADLQSYFDKIPHDKLMEKVERHISDGEILKLLKLWLKQDVMEEEFDRWTPNQGSPQGAVISPLLANIYLHDLDKLMTEKGYRMVRYADDFVILCQTEQDAAKALEEVKEWTEEHELTIHPDKTHMGNAAIEGQGFEFLGYRFEAGKRWIRNKSIQKFRDSIRSITKRANGRSMEEIIHCLNPMLKGWYNYFKHVNKYGLETFDGFIRRRLRAILLKRDRHPGFGRTWKAHTMWPNSYFTELGLFSLELTRAREAGIRP